nr:hypothetical protein [Nitrospiraceae bacterium]
MSTAPGLPFPNHQHNDSTKVVKGLATLALLKANLELEHDQIEIFLPLVLDCIAALSSEDFGIEQIQPLLLERHSFQIPSPIIKVLLNRAKHKGFIRREYGRYFRLSTITEQVKSIEDKKTEIEAEHRTIADKLISFSQDFDLEIKSQEEALALIFRYFAQNKINFLIGDFKKIGAFIKEDLKTLDSK